MTRPSREKVGALFFHLTKVACVKLNDRKTPITAADLLNDRVIPFFDSHAVKLLRLLTDRNRSSLASNSCGTSLVTAATPA